MLFMRSKFSFPLAGILMFQRGFFFWKIAVENIGFVFAFLCGRHKNNSWL